MRQLLGQPPREEVNAESVPVIISRVGPETESDAPGSAALIVDAIGEGTEALVRGLGRHASRWRGIGGATRLADGTLALMLDLPRLIEINL
jgi:chemotaxis protein histidine kinase CheA